MNWQTRTKALMKRRNITQDDVAAYFGVTRGAIGHWLSGRRQPSVDEFNKLATFLGSTVTELLGGGEAAGVAELEPTGYVRLVDEGDAEQVFVNRVKGARFAAGSGELVFEAEEIDKSHGFRRDYMQRRGLNPSRCKLFTVKGESMLPTLTDGAVVLVNMADREVVSGLVYALIVGDGLRVKRLFRRPDGVIEMRSDNPMQHMYPPEPIYDGNAAVIGRVVWQAGDL